MASMQSFEEYLSRRTAVNGIPSSVEAPYAFHLSSLLFRHYHSC
jgi:hypothetical protein